MAGDEILEGPAEEPAAVVVGDAHGFYCLMVERDLDAVSIEGDADAVRAILALLPPVQRADATVAISG